MISCHRAYALVVYFPFVSYESTYGSRAHSTSENSLLSSLGDNPVMSLLIWANFSFNPWLTVLFIGYI